MTVTNREQRRRVKAELAMRALAKHGSPKNAAIAIGVAESTLRKRVGDYLVLNGYDTIPQAVYGLDRDRISA